MVRVRFRTKVSFGFYMAECKLWAVSGRSLDTTEPNGKPARKNH